MTVSSAYNTMADQLKVIIDAEFADLGITAEHDNLHESLGRDRREIGIAPIEEAPPLGNGVALQVLAEVRFYDFWKQEITPTTSVDPRIVAEYAERFRRACREAIYTDPTSGSMWYFDVTRITYPNDPTGNKTRFVATVRAYGNNSALVETTG